jgi:hypothetical protein
MRKSFVGYYRIEAWGQNPSEAEDKIEDAMGRLELRLADTGAISPPDSSRRRTYSFMGEHVIEEYVPITRRQRRILSNRFASLGLKCETISDKAQAVL